MEGLYLLFKKLEDKYPRSHFGGCTHHITFDELRFMIEEIIEEKQKEENNSRQERIDDLHHKIVYDHKLGRVNTI